LDEVTTLAPSLRGSLSTWMSNLRKYFISINLIIQEYSSLESHFQFDAPNIYANAFVKVFFTSQPLETATKLSQIIGNTTKLDEHNKPQIMPLYSASQIRQMPSDQVLLVAGNRDVYKFSIVPFYKQHVLNFRSKIPPVYSA
jgi:type IV secretory pathway TraG/TraD family ATPase VirD4